MPFSQFTQKAMTDIANQIQIAPSHVMSTCFQRKTMSLADSVEIKFKKTHWILLNSVSPNSESNLIDTSDHYVVNVKLPRFPVSATISASEINQLNTIGGNSKTEAVSSLIGDKLAELIGSINATYDYMAIGALAGKIMDGAGNVLFEFVDKTNAVKIGNRKIIEYIAEIEKRMRQSGINYGYSVLCSYDFMSKLAEKAEAEDLFNKKIAEYQRGEKVKLVVYGVEFTPCEAELNDKKFIESAIVYPRSPEAYKFYYTRANHVDAIDKTPQLYFSPRPEPMSEGRGYKILVESRGLPVCVRPDLICKLSF